MMPDEVVAVRRAFVDGNLRRGRTNEIARYRPALQFVGHARIADKLCDLAPTPMQC